MKPSKKSKLDAAGWKVGSTGDFLGLNGDEETFLELKLALLSDHLKKTIEKENYPSKTGAARLNPAFFVT